MLSIHRGLKDIFDLNIPSTYVYQLKATLASYYVDLSKEILSAILSSEVIHIDETSIKLRKTTGYVWVICSPREVYYIFRDSREGSFLKDMLTTYQGVLVSDFFTAYDSLKCRQQKCLVHLMRDINDDLRRNPYDQELRSIAEPFAKLLKAIVLAIDQYGLRRRHLHKYAKPVEKMCSAITKQRFQSPCALKYQSRFEKYRDRLFTFLDHDGVPWNNNNAEHAVHRFAKIRRISDGTFTRSSAERLLVLLSVLETCEYRNVNPLKFLLSGQRHLRELESCEHRDGTNFANASLGKERGGSGFGPRRHTPLRLRAPHQTTAGRRYKRAVARNTAELGEHDAASFEHKRRRPRIVSLNKLLPDIFEGFRSSFSQLRYRVLIASDLWTVRVAQIDLQRAMMAFVYVLRRETRQRPLILSAKNVRFGTPDPTLGLVGRYVAISLSDGGRPDGTQRPSREDPAPSGLEKEISLSQACISARTLGGAASAKLVRTGRKSLTTIVTTYIPMYVPKPHAVRRAPPHKTKPRL
jgi:Transposase IS66 family